VRTACVKYLALRHIFSTCCRAVSRYILLLCRFARLLAQRSGALSLALADFGVARATRLHHGLSVTGTYQHAACETINAFCRTLLRALAIASDLAASRRCVFSLLTAA